MRIEALMFCDGKDAGMLSSLLRLLLVAVTLLLLSQFLPGILVSGWPAALLAALVFGVVNLLVRPLLTLLTLPIDLLTLGLFSLVINAVLFALTAALVPGFDVSNFFSAFIGALVLALITGLTENALRLAS
jgi:putative membrane protein